MVNRVEACVVTVVWMAGTYGLAFGFNDSEGLQPYIGSFRTFFLAGVTTSDGVSSTTFW